MSLILQALKKAEAEREVGKVPTLATAIDAPRQPTRRPRRTALWTATAAIAATAAAGAAWWWWPTDQPLQPAAAPAPTPPTAAVPSSLESLAAIPSPPARVMAPVSIPPSEPRAATPKPLPQPPPRPAAAPRPAPKDAERVPELEQLAAEMRSALPALKVSGTIWSEVAADRMLMIDGQVLREGDAVAPGLQLVRIGQRAALLRFRGAAFSLPYPNP